MAAPVYVLSLQQPWATLLVHGVKTIEVRKWATTRRGRISIHAALVPDPRPEASKHVPAELAEEARQTGGIIGEADLTGCVIYRTVGDFCRDQKSHLNEPQWFEGPALYGFQFANASPVPFRKCPGWMRFFPEKHDRRSSRKTGIRTGLLVSVRSLAEAQAALEGGADLIDVKEPRRGSLGKADDETIAQIADFAVGRRPLSATMGELREHTARAPSAEYSATLRNITFLKWGLAGFRDLDWRSFLDSQDRQKVVTVAYADAWLTNAPSMADVVSYALDRPGGVLLVDTWCKTSPPARPLLGWMSVAEIATLCDRCREANVRIALAGSLDAASITLLKGAAPDWFAVRGAACDDGRTGCVAANKVHELAELIKPLSTRYSGGRGVGVRG